MCVLVLPTTGHHAGGGEGEKGGPMKGKARKASLGLSAQDPGTNRTNRTTYNNAEILPNSGKYTAVSVVNLVNIHWKNIFFGHHA